MPRYGDPESPYSPYRVQFSLSREDEALVNRALTLTGKLNPDVRGSDGQVAKELLLAWARAICEASTEKGSV